MHKVTLLLGTGLLLTALSTARAETNAVVRTERDPFWPIGYAPASAPQTVTTNQTTEAAPVTAELQDRLRAALGVTGIMKVGSRYVARVNGQLVGAGENVTVQLDGKDYVFQVRDITKDAVRIDPIE